ncbi:DUF2157 domain-containing protein [Paraherbaspirillum soli]|uniref:DUF2157 domain-containing protein n=1 Tax=Paraherbaspirillum soli TaxID=631222 RepID=A0ABW0MDH5_9BURK
MSEARQAITYWLQRQQLSPAAAEQGLRLAGELPDGAAWRRFLERVFLFGGALLLACGVIFFFAFNWQQLPRIAKFGLLQVLLSGAALLAWHYSVATLKGQAALLAAMLLCGALLAYFGQTYQTGADPYQLFLTWSVLILPWVLVARLAAAWCLWLGLLNLALLLYIGRLGAGLFDGLALAALNPTAYALLFWLDLLALSAAEKAAAALPSRLLARFAGLLLLASLLPSLLTRLFAHYREHDQSPWMLLSYLAMLAVLAGFFAAYRRRRDLFLLAAACFSLIVLLTGVLIKWLLEWEPVEWMHSWLIVGLFLVASSAGAALWLRRIQQQWAADASR